MNIIKKFIKENQVIFNLFILSLIIIFLYIYTKDIPELFNYGEEVFNLIFQLSIAYIVSLIFYIIVNYIPEKKRNNRYKKIAFLQLSHPLGRHIRLFQYIYKSTLYSKPEEDYEYPLQMI